MARYDLSQAEQWAALTSELRNTAALPQLFRRGGLLSSTQRASALAPLTPSLAAAGSTAIQATVHAALASPRATAEMWSTADQAVLALQAAELNACIPPGAPGFPATPQERTAWAVDASYAMGCAVDAAGGGQAIGAQLQASFLAFFLGQSLHAFHQWKALLCSMCRAERALALAAGAASTPTATTTAAAPAAAATTGPPLSPVLSMASTDPNTWVCWLSALQAQLLCVPAEFFSEEDSTHNFVRASFKALRRTVQDHSNLPSTHAHVWRACVQCLEAVREHFAWPELGPAALGAAQGSTPSERPREVAPGVSPAALRAALGDAWDSDESLPPVVSLGDDGRELD